MDKKLIKEQSLTPFHPSGLSMTAMAGRNRRRTGMSNRQVSITAKITISTLAEQGAIGESRGTFGVGRPSECCHHGDAKQIFKRRAFA